MKHLYLPLLLALLTSACSPLTVLRIQPTDEARIDRYLYGAAVQTQRIGDLEVSASYYDADRRSVVFDLEFYNAGDRPILYDPVRTWLLEPDGSASEAIDPELQLFSMDIREVKNIRTSRIMTAASIATLAGSLALGSVGDAGAGVTDANLYVTGQQLATDFVYLSIDVAATTVLSRQRAALPDDNFPSREFWLRHSMRKTTIRPGERAFGKLVFKRQYGEGYIQLVTEVEDREVAFDFVKREYRIRDAPPVR